MHRGIWRQGPLVAVAALVLGVLIAQIAVAGGSDDDRIATLEREVKQLKAQSAHGPTANTAKKKKSKRGPRGPAGPQGPAGPPGGTGSPGPPGTAPACQGNGSGDTMVAAGAVCIDRYEASIWTAAEGGTQITGTIPCNANGQDCTNIYARSVPAVAPRDSITYFQAQQALANSGKRLPSNAEWQQAVAGTPDSTACNVDTGLVASTGANASCISNHGANDMVGNLWEWVGDWDEESAGCANWPAGFGSDFTCLGRADTQASTRFPGALIRGGSFFNGAGAGPFAVDGVSRPSVSSVIFGFRGAR